jgi:hypothetical protein
MGRPQGQDAKATIPLPQGTTVYPMFGAQCLFASSGRMFAFIDAQGRVVARLMGPEHQQALELGGEPFYLRPGVPFGRWVRLPTSLDRQTVGRFLDAAHRDVIALGLPKHGHRSRGGL